MTDVDQYIQAATRDNTRLSYRAAVEHFESQWGGFLPATADSVARYLVAYANVLSVNTLRQRLAGLAAWHLDQGFPDPTKAPHVKKVLKGIAELHPVIQKQAKPIQLSRVLPRFHTEHLGRLGSFELNTEREARPMTFELNF